jgi:hypothetical protein
MILIIVNCSFKNPSQTVSKRKYKRPPVNNQERTNIAPGQVELTQPPTNIPKSNYSKFKEWFKDNPFITIVGVVVLSIGSFISISNYINSFPKFNFHLTNFIMGIDEDDSTKSLILISGILYDSGDKPFAPSYFSAKLKYDDIEIPFTVKRLNNNDFFFNALTNSFTHYDSLDKKDLQNIKIVHPSEPIYGNLSFVIPITFPSLTGIAQNKNATIEICCTDAKGKKHYDEFKFHPHLTTQALEYPKNGIKTIPFDSLNDFLKKK